jgi:hypothetical protein
MSLSDTKEQSRFTEDRDARRMRFDLIFASGWRDDTARFILKGYRVLLRLKVFPDIVALHPNKILKIDEEKMLLDSSNQSEEFQLMRFPGATDLSL